MDLQIDISDRVSEYGLSEQDVNSLTNFMLDSIVNKYEQAWSQLIDSELTSTRETYKRAMYSLRPDDRTAIIGLTGSNKLAMMLEQGASVFDQKSGFEQSDKRIAKDDGGWYLTIPFRHGTSEVVTGSSVGESLPSSIYEIAKNNNGAAVKKEQLPAKFNEQKIHKIQINTGSVLEYKHKAPIFEGLIRSDISSTGKEDRGGYYTFRRVSDKSETESWMHPGLEKKDLMGKAMKQISSEIGDIVSNTFKDFINLNFGE